MKLLKSFSSFLGRSNSKGSSISGSASPKTISPSKAFNDQATVPHGMPTPMQFSMASTSSKSNQHEIIVDSLSSSALNTRYSELSRKYQSLSADFLHELEEVFRLFDSNGDGKISVFELGSVLRSLGDAQSEEELQQLVKEVDIDGDGYVDLEEFVKLNAPTAAAGKWASLEELKDVFNVFDADKNGYITAEELHHVLLSLGDSLLTVEDCHQMIRGVDADGDGFVNFEEFHKMMTGP